MDSEGFRRHSENALAYIVHYSETFAGKSQNVDVYKKYVEALKSQTAPIKGEPFEKIMDDFEKYIIPGSNPVQNPGFHAFLPSCNSSYLGILIEMVGVTLAGAGFNWNMSPFGKDLESIVLDWYGRLIGLPDYFLHRGCGGCIIHDTIHGSIVACMVTARKNLINRLSRTRFSISKPFIVASLVAYCTKEAEYKLSQAVITCMVILRTIDTDENFCMPADTLAQVIEEDKALGLMPFFVNVTIGNIIGNCDSLEEIGIICEENGLWLNVDASYAGNTLVRPEYRHYIESIEFASSVNVNFGEWMMVHHDCVLLFVKNLLEVSDNIMVERRIHDYGFGEEWGFSSQKASLVLQLCLFIRSYGSDGLQERVKKSIKQAELFKMCMAKDKHFKILNCNFGKVFFQLKSSNAVNEAFIKAINTSEKLILSHTVLENVFIICLDVCSECSCADYTQNVWNTIKEIADKIFEAEQSNQECNVPRVT